MFLFFAIIARHYGRIEFGEFSYYFALATMVFAFFDNGGDLYQMPLFVKYGVSQKLLLRIVTIKTLFFLVVLSLTLIYVQNIKIVYLLIAFYLEALVSLGRSVLFYKGEFIRESIYHASEKLVLLIVVLIGGLWMDYIIIMYLSLTVGKVVYLALLIARNYGVIHDNSGPKLLAVISGSWSYVLHAGLVAIALQFDVILMKNMGLTYEQIALYSAAIRIVMAVTVIPQILFNYYYPDVSRTLNEGDKYSLVAVLERARLIEWSAAIVIMFSIALTSVELIHIVYGNEFYNSAMLLSLLSIVVLFRFTRYSDSAVVSASENNKLKLYVAILAVVVGILLNIALIPKYGVFGPVVAVLMYEVILWIGFRLSALTISNAVKPIKGDLLIIVLLLALLLPIIVGMQDMQYARLMLLVLLWTGMAAWFSYRWYQLNMAYK